MFFKIIFRTISFIYIVVLLVTLSISGSASNGQTKKTNNGQVTGLPIPRFVSVKSTKVNVRRGPDYSYKIDWIYTRAGIPLKIDAEYGNWRRVIDFQGEGGWVHSRLLSGKRYIIFLKSKAILKRKPNKKSPPVAIIQKGVIAKLISSDKHWSEISINGYSGWILNDAIWGTATDIVK